MQREQNKALSNGGQQSSPVELQNQLVSGVHQGGHIVLLDKLHEQSMAKAQVYTEQDVHQDITDVEDKQDGVRDCVGVENMR